MSANKPKTAKAEAVGNYEVGYGKPPKATRFQPGQSGNPAGRPRGRPSFDELLLEEAARVVKVKIGDKVVNLDKDRALLRKLFEMALQGDIRALQLVTTHLNRIHAAETTKTDHQEPLTEEERAVLEMMMNRSEARP